MKKVAKTEEEFRSLRSRSIGSSEIGTIMLVNEYQTPYDLWLIKTGRQEGFKGNEATRRGQLLEPVVAKMFEEKSGYKIKEGSDEVSIFYKESFMSASPDRFYYDDGENRILECKTSAMDIDPDAIPMSWFCQLQWQMGVIGVQKGAIAWMGNRFAFDYVEFHFNEDFFNQMEQQARSFWALVESDTPPELVNASDVVKMYPVHKAGKAITAGQSLIEIHTELKDLQAAKKQIDDKLEAMKDEIKMIMKDAERVVYQDKALFTFAASRPAKRLDSKALKAAHPEIYESFVKEGEPVRRFLIK